MLCSFLSFGYCSVRVTPKKIYWRGQTVELWWWLSLLMVVIHIVGSFRENILLVNIPCCYNIPASTLLGPSWLEDSAAGFDNWQGPSISSTLCIGLVNTNLLHHCCRLGWPCHHWVTTLYFWTTIATRSPCSFNEASMCHCQLMTLFRFT